MKQILQNLRSGETTLVEVPSPRPGRGQVLIQTRRSLVSAGTERMLVEFGKASLLAKAKSQPDKVKQVLDKIRTDGLLPTLEAVFNRLDEPLPLGYCNAGVVLEVGASVTEFAPGDRVVSNGPHAEIVCVPRTLCAKIPDGVTDEEAAFTVLSSIGLQGVRLLQPTLGESFVVYGLGLIGLLSVQLLRASGCEVLGVDIDPRKLAMAESFGATIASAAEGDPLTAVQTWTKGQGADGVLIAASSKSDEIAHFSAQMCRKRGRVVLVGVVGLNLRRSDFYEKEITFQVSCSYGPGRYDESYEQGGQDYPLGFVRWTEGRNLEAVLDALQAGRLKVTPLISQRVPFLEAPSVYQSLGDGQAGGLGVVLEYTQPVETSSCVKSVPVQAPLSAKEGSVAVIGAGNYSKMTLLPALRKAGIPVAYVADLKGEAAQHLAAKYGAAAATTDYKLALHDPCVSGVIIAVGHNLHATLACECLRAGKHVFVEKPLALQEDQLATILTALQENPGQQLMVGFNRRFSRHTRRLKELLARKSEPLAIHATVNAGGIPKEHWVHDPARGGGRIIGEACHFIDLMVFLTGSLVRTVSASRMGEGVSVRDDKMSISLGFEDGSIGTVDYFANGSKSYPKETIEVFSEGRVARIDNFKRTKGFGFKGFNSFATFSQDKGHSAGFSAFYQSLSKSDSPLIPQRELVNVTLTSFAAVKAAHECRTVVIAEEYGSLLR